MNVDAVRLAGISSPEGARIYARTATLVLGMAVRELFEEAAIVASGSVSQSLAFEVRWKHRLTAGDVQALETRMRDIAGRNEPIAPVRMDAGEARAELFSAGRADAAALVRDGEPFLGVRCGGALDTYYGPLAPSTAALGLFRLSHHPPGLLLALPNALHPDGLPPFTEMPKLLAARKEASELAGYLDVADLAGLNAALKTGRGRELVRVCEAWQDRRIARVAELIRRDRRRVVLVAGPSSSGKTTFARRLMVHLNAFGLRPLPLSLDDYYLDRNSCPHGPGGTVDVESVDALDLPLLSEQAGALLSGLPVHLAKFDFRTGRSARAEEPSALAPGHPLIIEGINALHGKVAGSVPAGVCFRVFVSALAQPNVDRHNRMSTADLRLIRRTVRDSLARGRDAARTIEEWPGVHAAEFRNIYPLQESADAAINSALLYELSALRVAALPVLAGVPAGHPSRAEADRLAMLLSLVEPLPCMDEIPPTSLLREFIGGSTFGE